MNRIKRYKEFEKLRKSSFETNSNLISYFKPFQPPVMFNIPLKPTSLQGDWEKIVGDLETFGKGRRQSFTSSINKWNGLCTLHNLSHLRWYKQLYQYNEYKCFIKVNHALQVYKYFKRIGFNWQLLLDYTCFCVSMLFESLI